MRPTTSNCFCTVCGLFRGDGANLRPPKWKNCRLGSIRWEILRATFVSSAHFLCNLGAIKKCLEILKEFFYVSQKVRLLSLMYFFQWITGIYAHSIGTYETAEKWSLYCANGREKQLTDRESEERRANAKCIPCELSIVGVDSERGHELKNKIETARRWV